MDRCLHSFFFSCLFLFDFFIDRGTAAGDCQLEFIQGIDTRVTAFGLQPTQEPDGAPPPPPPTAAIIGGDGGGAHPRPMLQSLPPPLPGGGNGATAAAAITGGDGGVPDTPAPRGQPQQVRMDARALTVEQRLSNLENKINSSLSNMEKKLDSFIKSFARERTTSAGTKRQLETSQQQRQKKPHREAPPLGEGMQDATHP